MGHYSPESEPPDKIARRLDHPGCTDNGFCFRMRRTSSTMLKPSSRIPHTGPPQIL